MNTAIERVAETPEDFAAQGSPPMLVLPGARLDSYLLPSQAVQEVAPAAEYLPASQVVQEVAPAAKYLPASQVVQALAAEA